jgi:hypothetical protein
MIGAKVWETRSWPTKHRGLLAIHASKNWHAGNTVFELSSLGADRPKFRPCFDRYFEEDWNDYYGDLAFGGIVSIVRLRGCYPTEVVLPGLQRCLDSNDARLRMFAEEQIAFGNFQPGRWAWLLEPVIEIRYSMVVRGYQGLWTLPKPVELWLRSASAGAGVYLTDGHKLLAA